MKSLPMPAPPRTAALLACALLFHSLLHAQSPVTISVDIKNPGAAIPADFSGLSFEASLLLPGADGRRYFRPDRPALVNLFHTLNIRNLRIGGNTSDRNVKQLPGQADLDSLFAFAKVAGVKVIYCLRLHQGDPQEDATTARYLQDHYAPFLDCFSIGQEPSAYGNGYSYANYRDDWGKFAAAISAAAPGAKFCGPGVHNNADWARRFMADFGHGSQVALITEHLYPGGAGGKVPTPEEGRDRMLAEGFVKVYQKLHDGFVPMAVSNGLPCRLEEVNNYFNGGATNVSNTFASALWGLDFMWWWAERGLAGLNFHTGDRVAAGSQLLPSKYTAFFSTPNGCEVRPLGYAIKAFALGSQGRLLPAALTNPDSLNLSAGAVLGGDKNLYLTIINKEHGAAARGATVVITQNSAAFRHGQVLFLTATSHDIAATAGVTLGGAPIQADGSWPCSWTPLPPAPVADRANSVFAVQVPSATAAVVKLAPD